MAEPPEAPTGLLARTPLGDMAKELREWLRTSNSRSLVLLFLGPLLLALNMRLANLQTSERLLTALVHGRVTHLQLWYGLFAIQLFLLGVVPVLVLRFVFREPLSEFGNRLRPALRLWPLFLLFLAVMLPIVWVSSWQPAFREFYPLYRGCYDGWGEFLRFEAGLFSLFVVQEFFFRGFLIEGLAPQYGLSAVLISTGIYGVGHFTKPFPEQLGSFLVGNLLGYIGLRYRTFWFGVAIHFAVAFAMDAVLVVPHLLAHPR